MCKYIRRYVSKNKIENPFATVTICECARNIRKFILNTEFVLHHLFINKYIPIYFLRTNFPPSHTNKKKITFFYFVSFHFIFFHFRFFFFVSNNFDEDEHLRSIGFIYIYKFRIICMCVCVCVCICICLKCIGPFGFCFHFIIQMELYIEIFFRLLWYLSKSFFFFFVFFRIWVWK